MPQTSKTPAHQEEMQTPPALSPAVSASPDAPPDYGEIARVFLKLGITAFGGPAAHIAMMEEELVAKRRWLTKERFVDLLGFTNLIPGPNSTELAIHLGYQRGGKNGLWLAGVCFIVPAMLIVLAFAYFYARFGQLPAVGRLLAGVKPVVAAIVLHALVRLFPSVVKGIAQGVLGAAVFALALLGFNQIGLLLVGGASLYLWHLFQNRPGRLTAAEPFSLLALFLTFLKIGSVLYGSGYVLLAFLQAEFVRRGLLTGAQMLDAVAVGQLTPGPVFTTATFIGYLLHGVPGGLVATLGIFLPSFLLVWLLHPLVEKLRRSEKLRHLLDGVNVASLALMGAVWVTLAKESLLSPIAAVIGAVSFALLYLRKIDSTWLILGGAAIGYFLL